MVRDIPKRHRPEKGGTGSMVKKADSKRDRLMWPLIARSLDWVLYEEELRQKPVARGGMWVVSVGELSSATWVVD